MAASKSLCLVALLVVTSGPQLAASTPEAPASEVVVAALPVGEVAGLPNVSNAIGEVEMEAQLTSEVATVAEESQVGTDMQGMVVNATEQAKLELAGLESSAAANLRGASGWGHGIFGETCCMCYRHFGHDTVLFAGEDYWHVFGGHSALWRCQHQCEYKCRMQGGHTFGCYDEQHLLAFDRQYGHRSGFKIVHQHRYGNIC